MADVTIPPLDCGYILSANGSSTAIVAFQEVGDNVPQHVYARANANTAIVHLIEGRAAPIAFRGIEGDSDIFEITFLVAIDTAGAPVSNADADRASFDQLIALIEDPTVNYVQLIDSHGRRWYTFAEFIQGSYTWQGNEAQATVKFTEIDQAILSTP